jgi:hypothetical protein
VTQTEIEKAKIVQAFYKKNGYEVFGILEDHPKGFNHIFYKRDLGYSSYKI